MIAIGIGPNREFQEAMTLNMKNKFRVLGVGIALGCSVTGCTLEEAFKQKESSQSQPASIYGAFSTEQCFLNKMATQGNGQDIYTDATLTFDSNGSGKSEFVLYTDSNCDSPVLTGEAQFTYEAVRTVGSIRIIQVDQQNDPSDPSNTIRYWLAFLVEQQGLTAEIDYRDGSSGPYLTAPTDAELAAFIADPRGQGSVLRRR